MAVKKRDVLFLCQFFYPEINSSATLPFDTANFFAEQGLKVGALCGYPKEYNLQGKVPRKENKFGIDIKRIHYLQLKRKSRLGRLINYATFTAFSLLHLFELRRYSAVIVYSNPPILPLIALIAKTLFNTKIICVSYDVYPEIAFASNSLKEGGVVHKAMERINKGLSRKADLIIALTEEMKAFILRSRPGMDAERISVIPNWAHEDIGFDRSGALRRLGFSDSDFIVCYFGNMGICQDVETLKEAVKILKDEEKIKFLIAGHGSKLPAFKEEMAGYPNVRIMDFLTGRDFEDAVSAGSCGLVTLEEGLKGMCAPSKYYTCIQGSLPVIAVVEEDSYLASEVISEGVGLHVRIGDGQGLAEAIRKLYADRDGTEEMAVRARELYFREYCMSKGVGKYLQLVTELLGKGNERDHRNHIN